MKLGLEKLGGQTSVEVLDMETALEQLHSCEIDVIDAIAELSVQTNMLARLEEASGNVADVKAAIEQFGINDTITSLVGAELGSIAGWKSGNAKQVGIALEANLKEVGGKIVEFLKKIWESIKLLFLRIFNYSKAIVPLAKKQAERVDKIGNEAEWKSEKTFKLMKADEKAKLDKQINKDLAIIGKIIAELKGKTWKGTDASYESINPDAYANLGDSDYQDVSTTKIDAAKIANSAIETVKMHEDSLKTINALKSQIDGLKIDGLKDAAEGKVTASAASRYASKVCSFYIKTVVNQLKSDMAMWKNIKDAVK